MILGVRGPPGGSLEEGTENDFKKLSRAPPFWDPIWEHFGSQIRFLCISFVPIFMFIFGIAFGTPPRAFLRMLGSFQGAFLGRFCILFCRCCRSQKTQPFRAKCLVWGVLGLRFRIFFAYFLNVFFMLVSIQPFWAILAELGLQNGSLMGSIFADFANFA